MGQRNRALLYDFEQHQEQRQMNYPVIQVRPSPEVTVALAATMTGLTEKAIRRKIEDGKWLEGREWFRSPDGGVFISVKAVSKWIKQGSIHGS